MMAKGYTICKSYGQPMHTHSKTCKCGQKMTKGRPCGTNQRARYDVSKSGGRPHGTTQEAGYSVNKSGGRPHGTTQRRKALLSKEELLVRDKVRKVSKRAPETREQTYNCTGKNRTKHIWQA